MFATNAGGKTPSCEAGAIDLNLLLTGGAGFIGRTVLPLLLADGHNVTILDALTEQVHGPSASFPPDCSAAQCVCGDIRDAVAVREAMRGVDVIVHLAAETGMGQSQYEVARYYDVNVHGMSVMLDVLANQPGYRVRRIVLASTSRVYGEGAHICARHGRVYPPSRPAAQIAQCLWDLLCPLCGEPTLSDLTREDDPLQLTSVYAATKVAQEQMLQVYARIHGMEAAVLRLQNVYGEGQALRNPYTGVLSVFCTRLGNRQPLDLFEDGKPARDFIHVSDVARAIAAASLGPAIPPDPVNIGSGRRSTIGDVATRLCELYGFDEAPRASGRHRLGDVRTMAADVTRAAERLGFSPVVGLDEGLGRLAQWAQRQPVELDRSEAAYHEMTERGLTPDGRQ